MSTKNNTRYSMRLRQNRGGDALSNLGGGDNDGGGDVAASSRSNSRAALVSLKGKNGCCYIAGLFIVSFI